MFNTDNPIETLENDLLGRASFAKAFGKAILSYNNNSSIVLGLLGKWGSGKTSIINMALQHIEATTEKDKKPVVVKFNPWNFSDQNQLVTQFFRQLSSVLQRQDVGGKYKGVAEKLEVLGNLCAPLVFVPGLAAFAGAVEKAAKGASAVTKNMAAAHEKDLNSIRTEIDKLLSETPNKILIVIDDIDRLNSLEIRQIFQLVKVLGNFSNTIYLLAFDKEVVVSALSDVQQRNGEDYLEKIVQVPVEVPQLNQGAVQKLLLNQLQRIANDIPDDRFESNHWTNIYQAGLKHLFKNARDVARYINVLSFGLELVKEEVDSVDFFALTAVQVFFPNVYYGIRDNKDLFAGIAKEQNEPKQQAKARCDEILDRADAPHREVLKDLLQRLFPKLYAVYGNTYYSSDRLGEWRRKGKISSPDNFDKFFGLSIPKDDFSLVEVKTILSQASNSTSFSEALTGLREDGRITRFLQLVEDYTSEAIPAEHIQSIIDVLINIGDSFPYDTNSFWTGDGPIRLARITYQLLKRLDTQEARFSVLKQSINSATESLYTIVQEIAIFDQEHGRYGQEKDVASEKERVVSSNQLDELEQLAASKIQHWLEDGRLMKQKHLPSSLFSWSKWVGLEVVRHHIADSLRADNEMIDFITGFLFESTVSSSSSYATTIVPEMTLDHVAQFVDLTEVASRLEKITTKPNFAELNQRSQLAINLFLKKYQTSTVETTPLDEGLTDET